MKYLLCFFLLSFLDLAAVPIKVPTHIYDKWPDPDSSPTFYPFITHFGYRSICDKIIDQCTPWFDPEEVGQGDTIYLNIWYLEWFVQEVHPKIQYPYILVTADVGGWLPHPNLKHFVEDPKLGAWFCRNMIFSHHPKCVQIPMGQDFAIFHPEDESIVPFLLKMIDEGSSKPYFLYMNHYPRSHGDRDKIVSLFQSKPYCFSRNRSDHYYPIDLFGYFRELQSSRFVLSPLGLETDCVRTWEALVLGSIPIVEHTFLDPLFDRLPVIIVHDWEEVAPAFLEKKYEEIKDRDISEAYFDYWANLIKKTQQKIKNNDLASARLEATKFNSQDLADLNAILEEYNPLSYPILYKGLLTSLRPMQLFHHLKTPIILQDYYFNENVYDDFDKYAPNYYVKKITLLENDAQFLNAARLAYSAPIFLDLTYYCTSLFTNFQTSIIGEGNLRHSLLKDLTLLYRQLPSTAFLFGNRYSDPYVQKVLEKFAAQNNVRVETRGSFWFIH